jgi:DGQHR domain-containing protein
MKKKFVGTILQEEARIYLATIPGKWLLKNTTPSWRIDNPKRGFQRMVSERRAREIAVAVLDQRRTFPNAIVLATDSQEIQHEDCRLIFPEGVRFLVVDGQHRLWAQQFSNYEADYGCVIHVGLSEAQMAAIFVEINDNQKRVPSSLRWDLVRLVRPDADPVGIRASELVELLNSERESPLFQRVDMTGEQPKIVIKQGSLAPEIKTLLNKKTILRDEGFDLQAEVLMKLFAAIQEKDPDGWYRSDGPLYRARVFRAVLKVLPKMLSKIGKESKNLLAKDFFSYIKRIDLGSLSDKKLRAVHGNAGIAVITRTIESQIFR